VNIPERDWARADCSGQVELLETARRHVNAGAHQIYPRFQWLENMVFNYREIQPAFGME
jgi:hypothetical protein